MGLGGGICGNCGGLGALPGGGRGGAADGLELCSLSDSDPFVEAPVAIPPPRLFNLGMPPAKMPPNWGALSMPEDAFPASLLALARPGIEGAERPGTGGAPPTTGAEGPFDSLATSGLDRSLVTAFFSFLPFSMSPNSAPYIFCEPVK